MPAELHGELVVGVVCCSGAPVEEGERVLAAGIRKAGPGPVRAEPYVDHQAMFDPTYPHGHWYYMRACDVGALTDEVIGITVEHAMRIESPLTAFPIWQMGGAVARVRRRRHGVHESRSGHNFNLTSDREPRRLRRRAAVDAGLLVGARAAPHGRVRQLPDGGGRRASARGVRRREVRPPKGAQAEYDPDNLFRLNQNIRPD